MTTYAMFVLFVLRDCDFVRIQDFSETSCICGLKARFELNINLLTLIQFYFFCSSVVSSVNLIHRFENAVLLEILNC